MRAVDTNVVLRLVVGDDADQTVTAERFVVEGAWVSVVVLLDATWKLRRVYSRGDAKVAATIEMLLHHPAMTLLSDAVAEALELYRQKPALGFADCLIFALARSEGHLPLGTFDRRLGKLEGAQTLR
jgi:predicted nucleic-acid-binding protein